MMIAESTKEMVADARMLVAELSKLHMKLAKVGIEVNLVNYEGGKLEAIYEHITTIKL